MRPLELDGGFEQSRIRLLRHQLAGHPLMSTESLTALALRIDPRFVRFHDGERSKATDMAQMLQTDPTRATLRRACDNLGKARAFVQIINVRSDPQYAALIDEVLDQALEQLPASDRVLLNRDAAAFLASPRSVTPFHLDHEQNFLCHVRGKKTLQVWEPGDREVVSERALELFYREGSLREVAYLPVFERRAHTFELRPGDAVYMPMGAPHAVATGDEVSVTFSVLMNTRSSMDAVEAYRANHLLRRLGVSPRPVGESPVRDAAKRRGLEALRWLRDRATGRRAEAGPRWY